METQNPDSPLRRGIHPLRLASLIVCAVLAMPLMFYPLLVLAVLLMPD